VKSPRRTFIHLAAGAAVLPAIARTSWAQAYPSRPVRIVVPFRGGSGGAAGPKSSRRRRGAAMLIRMRSPQRPG